jgi:hypothetical protein
MTAFWQHRDMVTKSNVKGMNNKYFSRRWPMGSTFRARETVEGTRWHRSRLPSDGQDDGSPILGLTVAVALCLVLAWRYTWYQLDWPPSFKRIGSWAEDAHCGGALVGAWWELVWSGLVRTAKLMLAGVLSKGKKIVGGKLGWKGWRMLSR